ncbi:MAG: hypothetical protein K0R51_3016, partial [Cytophagaceae bacterium]|nr:hypothetical protein [Cytophagaceae bacterium]
NVVVELPINSPSEWTNVFSGSVKKSDGAFDVEGIFSNFPVAVYYSN